MAERRDSAGVEIVTNPAEDRVLDWQLRELHTVGGEAEGPASFYEVDPNVVGADTSGNLYVLDRIARRVTVFDAAGRPLRTVGRPGEGPGELGRPLALAVDPDGGISVLDNAKAALVQWDPDGEPFGRHALTVRPLSPLVRPALRDPGSGILVAVQEMWRQSAGPPSIHLRWFRDTDTVVLATLDHPPIRQVVERGCGMRLYMTPVFPSGLFWSVGPGERVSVSAGPAYDVQIFREDSLIRRVRRAVELQPATRELARVEVADEFTLGSRGRTCTVDLDDVVDDRGFEEHIPWIAALALSPEGELWVRRYAVGEKGPVDVFGPDGEYRGTLPPETPFPLIFLSGNRIAVQHRDAYDVERLVVMEVRR